MARATAPAKVKAAPPKKAKAKALGPVAKKAAPTGKKEGAGKKGAVEKKAAPGKMAPAAKKKAAAKMAAAPVKKAAAPVKKAAAPKKKAQAVKVPAPKKGVVRLVVVAKKAAPRRAATRVAVPMPAARRGRAPAAVRGGAARALSKAGAQVFTVSHLNDGDFKADGLRSYALYRDLGIAAATSGLCQAHVIRFVPPCTDVVRKRHLHKAELQLVYVLQGWMKNEFEGVGEQMMSAGSCWIQPSGVEHTVLDYSPDCEVLEIIVPADFKTEEV
jgi:uncharacterized RmlC-like cupin family protein